jgi:surface antigen
MTDCRRRPAADHWRRVPAARWLALLPLALLAACSTFQMGSKPHTPASEAGLSTPATSPEVVPSAALASMPRVVPTDVRWECVTYARSISDVQLYGNAWTWWKQAAGLYDRGHTPEVGSVLVLKRRGGSQGHVAVVTRVIGSRLILVEQANWLNRHQIEKDTPVLDVSSANDWSAVRVWYIPGATWGSHVYPAYGFIYPGSVVASQ